jgi:hypothetical protein
MGTTRTQAEHFSNLELTQLYSPGFRIYFNGLAHWVDTGNDSTFQVTDPRTGTSFSASAYDNPGLSLPEWAKARAQVVQEGMPYFTLLKPPVQVKGNGWNGMVWEYDGTCELN